MTWNNTGTVVQTGNLIAVHSMAENTAILEHFKAVTENAVIYYMYIGYRKICASKD
jgi:hypothetical protein